MNNIIEGTIGMNGKGWCFMPKNTTMPYYPIHESSLIKFHINSLTDASGDWKAEIIDEFSHPHLYRNVMLWSGVEMTLLIEKI